MTTLCCKMCFCFLKRILENYQKGILQKHLTSAERQRQILRSICETTLSLVPFSCILPWVARGKQVVRCLQGTIKDQGSLRKDNFRQLHIFQKGIGNFLHLTWKKHQSIFIWLPWTSAVGLTPPAHPLCSGAPLSSGPAPACSWIQEYIH